MEQDKIININTIKELQKNVMFRLSLTSKELFHSNFLAWIFETYPNECSEIFKISLPKTNEQNNENYIKREANIGKNEDKKCIADILIKNKDKEYIIENKFKSIPNLNQLNDYKKINKNYEIILLSYFKPLFESNFKYWSYKYLENNLSELLNKIRDNENKEIIKNYVECLNLLNNLQDEIKLEDNMTIGNIWEIITKEENKTKLNEINFEKTFQRIYAAKLTEYLLKDYDKKTKLTIFIDCGRDLTVYSDILFCFKNSWDKDLEARKKLNFLGVSVWGKFFRYYAGINNRPYCLNKKDRKKAYEKLEQDYNWFFTDKTNKQWGGYCYDNEMYLYKKEDISNLTLKKLKEKIKDILNNIYKNEKNNLESEE